jgi:PAS domain S-box-containing protein
MLAATVKRARIKRKPSARDLKKRYELVMGAINESVYDWDIAHGRFVTSGTMQNLLGLPRERLTLAGWQKSIHPEDFPRFRDATVAHLKGLTQRFECDYRFRAQDGTWRWARTHGLATRDRNGRATRMVGSTGDITELKTMEERQAAVTEILAAMSASPTDTGPVFEAIVHSALRLFPDAAVYIRIPQGAEARLVAIAHRDPKQVARLRKQAPAPLTREYLHGAAILDRRVVDVVDAATHDEASIAAGLRNFMASGYRAVTIMPMLRGDTAIGTIAVARQKAGPLAERQVALLRTFADEAVIAIENVRLFNETKEALERQTATAEILTVMSNSTTDVQPVFDAIVKNVQRLFGTGFAVLQLVRDGRLELAAFDGQAGFERIAAEFPRPLSGDSIGAKAIRARGTVQLSPIIGNPDAPERSQRMARTLGYNSLIGTPMLRADGVIGAIVTGHPDGRPFSDKQAALLKAFADQAVIAIENVRLFNATNEALEQQTATAEILRVMASSPADVGPVFEAIVRTGVRLFPGAGVTVACPENGQVRLMAIAERDPERARRWTERFPFPLSREYMHGVAMLDCRMVDMPDVEQMDDAFAAGKRNFAASGYRAMTVVPMVKDGSAIGSIAVVRDAPGQLSSKQIALLKTFADQAVIAIDNVRLFNETKEALEHQKASGEVLGAISGSIADTQPVFDKILDSCERLFAGRIVGLNVVREDGKLHIGAYHGAHRQEFERIFPIPITGESGSGLAIVERRVIHYPDAQDGAEVPVRTRQGCRAIGVKSAIFAPVLWEGRGLGAIFVGRDHSSSFSGKEIGLLRTFADQAAIAIENVRLFNETKEALEQQTATADVLKVISRSTFDLQTVLDTLVESATRLCAADHAWLFQREGEFFKWVASYGHAADVHARIRAYFKDLPVPVNRGSVTGRTALEAKVIQVPDVLADPDYTWSEAQRIGGYRSALGVPLLREGSVVGVIFLAKTEPKPFSARQIELATTFADQAVIAIENVRLFNEIQEKSWQLEIASRHKSEFLANMSHELRTPLNAIIGFTRIVMRRSKDALEAKQYENLEKILASGQHLLALINAILDLSKIEAGRVELVPSETALAPVLEQCLRTVEPLVKVSLLRAFDGGLPRMYVDEEKLRQIVINLLSNAAKFTEQGSIRLQAQASNGSVAIAVADTGIGIPEDKLGVIFEEFEQVDASTTRVHGGTGLGLAIARRLARLMGGDIGVHSSPGAGSTFTLTLPVRYPG